MGFVFTILFVLAVVSLVVAMKGMRASHGLSRGVRGFGAVVAGVAFVVLLGKFAYEELYPRLFVDQFYCDFASTQDWNMLGWEF